MPLQFSNVLLVFYKQLHVISALYGPQKQMMLLPLFLHLQIEDLRTYLPFAEHYIKKKKLHKKREKYQHSL